MFFDYLALLILILGLLMVFYVFVYIHDLPHAIAKKRHHPHEEAIHVACWLSLLTLHAIWPIVYLWAVSHKPGTEAASLAGPGAEDRVQALEERVKQLEATLAAAAASKGA